MRDITLGDTFTFCFTTRTFGTGVPTTLGGSPALSVKEGGNDTFITAGISVDVDTGATPVTGLNEVTIIATGANGYEVGKSYAVFISSGTVGGTSVVGEVVEQFTVQLSAAAVDLANGTDGLGAIKADTAAILVDTGTTLDGKIDAIDAVVDAILVDTAEIGAAGSGLSAVPWNAAWDAEVQSEVTDALLAALPESYRANGATGSVAQILYEILAHHGEAAISGTTKAIKKIDHSTGAATFTLDSATDPTSITRAT